jgi:hypothetical protein
MRLLVRILIAAATVAFILAILGAIWNFRMLNVAPEGYSRACSNLALIAIALILSFRERGLEA